MAQALQLSWIVLQDLWRATWAQGSFLVVPSRPTPAPTPVPHTLPHAYAGTLHPRPQPPPHIPARHGTSPILRSLTLASKA